MAISLLSFIWDLRSFNAIYFIMIINVCIYIGGVILPYAILRIVFIYIMILSLYSFHHFFSIKNLIQP